MSFTEELDLYQCQHAWELYTASLYFSVYTLIAVGYGDIVPKKRLFRISGHPNGAGLCAEPSGSML